jgi:hypothetical protein
MKLLTAGREFGARFRVMGNVVGVKTGPGNYVLYVLGAQFLAVISDHHDFVGQVRRGGNHPVHVAESFLDQAGAFRRSELWNAHLNIPDDLPKTAVHGENSGEKQGNRNRGFQVTQIQHEKFLMIGGDSIESRRIRQ